MNIIEFRNLCGRIAYIRDNGQCQLCRIERVPTTGSETHHVIGRAMADDWTAEHWLLRLTLCSRHHQMYHHDDKVSRKAIYRALQYANTHPVNHWRPDEIEGIIFARDKQALRQVIALRDRAVSMLGQINGSQ